MLDHINQSNFKAQKDDIAERLGVIGNRVQEIENAHGEYAKVRTELKDASEELYKAKIAYKEELKRVAGEKENDKGILKRMLGLRAMKIGEFADPSKKYEEARQKHAEVLASARLARIEFYETISNENEGKTRAAFFNKYVVKEAESLVTMQKEALSPEKQGTLSKSSRADSSTWSE